MPAHRLPDLDVHLTIREPLQNHLPELAAYRVCDRLPQSQVAGPGEERERHAGFTS
jgi:hypothetical protein